MPRTRAPLREVPAEPPNTMVASAADVTRTRRMRPRQAGGLKNWQSEAYRFFDTIGEVRFACTWLSNALSRVKLVVKTIGPDGEEEELETGPAVDALHALFTEVGPGQFMAMLGLHLTIAGESYMIGEVDPFTGEDTWSVYSTEEVSSVGEGDSTVWSVDRGDGFKRELDQTSLVIRIWRSHPRKWAEADSPIRATLPVLKELEQLTKYVAAVIDSRLGGAGILMLPSEMTFGAPAATDTGQTPGGTPAINPTGVLEMLGEAFMTPLEDRSAPSSIVPFLMLAPGALLGNAQWLMPPNSKLDDNAVELRQEGIRRFALGMDLPPEIVLGQGDANHWGAWQIDEAGLKIHIEPLCSLITSAITKQYILPALEGSGQRTGQRIWVEADTSELRLRPDHSGDARELYDRLELSGEALRRENGFDESDKPEPSELTELLRKKVARDTPDAAMVAAALDALGADLEVPEPEPTPTPLQIAPDATQDDLTPDNVRELPQTDDNPRNVPQTAALMAPCELLVLRAVERAHSRLQGRNGRGKNKPPRGQYDDTSAAWALEGAWEFVPLVADRTGVDPEWLTARLNNYAGLLLTKGFQHRPEALEKMLGWAPPEVGRG